MEKINSIMINKGDVIPCIETLKVKGMTYFIGGKSYDSPENNCLKSEQGEVFVPQQYLTHFIFKTC